MDNVWGTKVGGIEVTVQRFLADGIPKHGGVMVDQANARNGYVYRASDGWNVELVGGMLSPKADVYLSAGDAEYGPFKIELFTHVGCDMPTADELESTRLADEARRAEEAAAEILEWLVADEEDVTLVYDKCTHCHAELSMTTGVTFKYPDGSLACSRCAMVDVAKSA